MDKESVDNRATSVVLPERARIKRVLSLWDLFAIGYGDLGSSIYYALGITAVFALGATPLALGIAGFVFTCTALSYAELSSIYHESGGSASFARHAFNDLISFIAGWALLLDYIVTIAISIFAISPYLAVFYAPLKDRDLHIGVAICLIVVVYFLNFFGIRRSTRTSLFLAGIALLTQIVIIVLGIFLVLNLPKVIEHLRIGVSGVDWSPTWPQFMRGIAMAMVAYTGIESVAQLGSEVVKPARNLPRAIFLNIIVLLTLYVGVSIIGLSVISPYELSHTFIDDPLAGIVQAFPWGGGWLKPWIGLLAALLLFVAANAGLVGSSRVAYNMGEYYQLPRFFSHIHPKFRSPYVSLLVFASLAILLILASRGQLDFLADIYNFGVMIAFFSTNLSLLVLRVKKPNIIRPFKIPCNITIRGYHFPISAIIGCIATLGIWILVVITKPEGRYIGFAWMIAGVLMFLIYRAKKGLATRGSLSIQKVKVPKFASLDVGHILVPMQSAKDSETVQLACELAKIHKAKVTIVHILEVPFAVPLDAVYLSKTSQAVSFLQSAEALAREWDIPVSTSVVRGRSFEETLLGILSHKEFDLLVVRWKRQVSDKIVHKCPCRVWLCYNN
ncbi:MAG: universal stress protein [Simkania sp.]|nr:universal stress protein [Simkania sp.]